MLFMNGRLGRGRFENIFNRHNLFVLKFFLGVFLNSFARDIIVVLKFFLFSIMQNNRFGFSERKSDARLQQFGYQGSKLSLEPNRFNEPMHASVQKPQQNHQNYSRPTAFSTARKPQNGPRYDFSQSALKPNNRQLSFGMGENLFASAKKMRTPKQSGHNFAMPKSVGQSARLSRYSTSGKSGKENARNFSDKEFLQNAQEEILSFLREHEFEFADNRQVTQPSIAMVSRIFEFLFGFFGFEVTIKNGKDSKQCLDIVVPEMVAELNYPFALKKSDFVSFVGDRQRGTIFNVILYLIGQIRQDYGSVEEDIIPKNIENDRDKQFGIEGMTLWLESDLLNDEQVAQKCTEAAQSLCGTSEQAEFLDKEIEKVEQNKQNVIDQVECINKLPTKLAVSLSFLLLLQ